MQQSILTNKKVKLKSINIKLSKKAQAWGLDLIIASTIFLVGIFLIYTYAINFTSETEETIDTMFYDGNIMASSILSEDYLPGILDNNKVNQTKLDALYLLSDTNDEYAELKKIFNTKYDFYFYFPGLKINEAEDIEGIGKPGVNSANIFQQENPDNLVKIKRFTIYKNKPVSFEMFVWS